MKDLVFSGINLDLEIGALHALTALAMVSIPASYNAWLWMIV